jgi:hypothetical protein
MEIGSRQLETPLTIAATDDDMMELFFQAVYPDVPWKDPIVVMTACRDVLYLYCPLCITRVGLMNQISPPLTTRRDFDRHMMEKHSVSIALLEDLQSTGGATH